MKKFYCLFLFAGSVISASAQDSSLTRPLDEVVVTATRYPIKQNLTGKVLTVIGREQLEKNSGRSLAELLNTQAGLTISGATGTPGTVVDIYFQGAAAGKTLILLDGIPAYDPSGTRPTYDLNLINTDEVERVEILKGSQSTLYGSDAVAGVINIITRKYNLKKIQTQFNLAAGSYGTVKASAGIGGHSGNTGYHLQYNKYKSDGISSAFDPSYSHTYDRDGFDENTFIAGVDQRINERLLLKANLQLVHYKADLDESAFTDDKNYTTTSKNTVAGFGADYQYGTGVLHFNYNYHYINRGYRDDSSAENRNYSEGSYSGYSHFAEAYTNISLNKNLDLLAGIDYRNQATNQHYLYIDALYGPFASPDIDKDSAHINQFAAYASLVVKNLEGFNLEAGARYNHFSQYGNVVTWSLNPSYLLNERVKFFANLSSGFSAPTLYQLYSEYRNPDGNLKPEKSLSFEGGVQFQADAFNVRALWFTRQIKDVIIFYASPSYQYYYLNQDKQTDHGAELELNYHIGKFSFSGNYTYVTGEVETNTNGKDTSFNNLYRRPKNTFNLSAGWQVLQKFSVSLALQSVGKRTEYAFGGPPTENAAYYTLNAYGEYAFSKKWKLFADFKNITDQKYFEIPGYNSKRFNFMTGVSVHL